MVTIHSFFCQNVFSSFFQPLVMIGTHQSKAEPWMLRNAMTDVDRMGLLFRFKSVEKSLTSISRAMDDHLPTFSRYKTHTASRPCVLSAIFRRSISLCESLGLAVEDFESVETLRRDLQYRDEFSSECLRINQQSKPCNDESNVARGSFTTICDDRYRYCR